MPKSNALELWVGGAHIHQKPRALQTIIQRRLPSGIRMPALDLQGLKRGFFFMNTQSLAEGYALILTFNGMPVTGGFWDVDWSNHQKKELCSSCAISHLQKVIMRLKNQLESQSIVLDMAICGSSVKETIT